MVELLNGSDVFNSHKSSPNYVSRVYEKKNNYEQHLPLKESEIEQLNKLDRYKEVYTSNHIEGNSYSEFETRALLDTGVTPNGKSLVDSLEISNLNRAILFCDSYDRSLDMEFIKNVHKIVTAGTLVDPTDEGEFKKTSNYIGDVSTCPVNAVNKEMEFLLKWFHENKSMLDPILLATRFKYRFLIIHPFINGNGRTSRILFNHIIKSFGFCGLIILPENVSEYYKALKQSNAISDNRGKKFKCEPLEEFLCDRLVECYERRIKLLESDW